MTDAKKFIDELLRVRYGLDDAWRCLDAIAAGLEHTNDDIPLGKVKRRVLEDLLEVMAMVSNVRQGAYTRVELPR